MGTLIQILSIVILILCITILSFILIAFITGWIESKNRKADLSKVDFLKLNRAYQKHVVAASRCKDEINKRLSATPTRSDGGVGNYKQAIDKAVKECKPYIVPRRIDPEELKRWIDEDKRETKP